MLIKKEKDERRKKSWSDSPEVIAAILRDLFGLQRW